MNATGCRPVAGGWPFAPAPGPFYAPVPQGPYDTFSANPNLPNWSGAPPSFYPPCLPGPTDWGTPFWVPPSAFDPWSLGYPMQQWPVAPQFPSWGPPIPYGYGPIPTPSWNSTTISTGPAYPVSSPASAPAPSIPSPPVPASSWPGPAAPPTPSPAPTPMPASGGQNRGLERIQEYANNGSWAAGRVLSALSNSESSGPSDAAGAAADALAKATSDNGESDSAEAGKQAESSLNEVERLLNQLGSGSSDLASVSSAVQSIRGELSGLDRSQLKNPGRLDSIEQSLSSVLSSLSPAGSAVSRLDSAADDARYSLRNARNYSAQVSNDSPGTDVSYEANRARGYAQSLQDQLRELSSQARSGGSEVTSIQEQLGQISSQAGQLLSEQA